MQGKYYIYHHLDPVTTLPVYVGKGSNDRAFDLTLRHSEHKKWIRGLAEVGLKPIVLIGNRFESEKEAYEVEKQDIAVLRQLGCKLFNISSGGAGNVGDLAKMYCRKPIICLNTGKEYDSTVSASEDLKMPTKRINSVLKGKKKSYKGYTFKYVDEKLNEAPRKIRAQKELNRRDGTQCKRVICNETGNIYVSYAAAAKDVGVNIWQMYKHMREKQDSVNGFTFKRI